MKFLKAFGQFWYDFLIGDDWKIAASVVLTLTFLAVLVWSDNFSDTFLTVLGGVLLMAAFTVSLLIDVRGTGSRR